MSRSDRLLKHAFVGALTVALLAFGTSATAQQMPQGGGPPGGAGPPPGGGPDGGRPPRMKPITIDLEDVEKTAREMFDAADLNSDGMVTIAELQDLTDRARDQAIGERFRSVDANDNQLIDPAEFKAWQLSLGALAYRDDGSRAYDVTHLPDAVGVPLNSNKKGPLLSIIMVPLSKITLIEANTNYDEGIDFREFLILQRKEFDKADGNSDDHLTDQEIRAWADSRRSQRPELIAGERPPLPQGQSREARIP